MPTCGSSGGLVYIRLIRGGRTLSRMMGVLGPNTELGAMSRRVHASLLQLYW